MKLVEKGKALIPCSNLIALASVVVKNISLVSATAESDSLVFDEIVSCASYLKENCLSL